MISAGNLKEQIMTIKGMTKVAVAAAVSGAMLLPATGAFAGDKTERALIGAILGGAAGAALSKGDTGGVAAGAAAGALVGLATAKPKYYSHRSYYRARPVQQTRYSRDYRPARDYYYAPREARYDPYGRW
jgi:hypothetical protein